VLRNLGSGPFDRIRADIVSYELKNTWYPWVRENKNEKTQLLGMEMMLGLFIYEQGTRNFDFMGFEMMKGNMTVKQRTEYLEKALKGESG
jgi:hypothetical protein